MENITEQEQHIIDWVMFFLNSKKLNDTLENVLPIDKNPSLRKQKI